jgi:hypothetical protein
VDPGTYVTPGYAVAIKRTPMNGGHTGGMIIVRRGARALASCTLGGTDSWSGRARRCRVVLYVRIRECDLLI